MSDQLSEPDGGDGTAVQPGDDAQQDEGNHGGQDLQADGVLGSAEEASDVEVLLDPSEQQLDLPPRLVESSDLDGRPRRVIGHQGEPLATAALDADQTQGEVEAGSAAGRPHDQGVAEHGEAVSLAVRDGPAVERS